MVARSLVQGLGHNMLTMAVSKSFIKQRLEPAIE